jgi:hypothetical protein
MRSHHPVGDPSVGAIVAVAPTDWIRAVGELVPIHTFVPLSKIWEFTSPVPAALYRGR